MREDSTRPVIRLGVIDDAEGMDRSTVLVISAVVIEICFEYSEIDVKSNLKARFLLSGCRSIDPATRERLLNDRIRDDFDFVQNSYTSRFHKGRARTLTRTRWEYVEDDEMIS